MLQRITMRLRHGARSISEMNDFAGGIVTTPGFKLEAQRARSEGEYCPFAWIATCISTICLALVMTGTSLPAYVFVACWIPFSLYYARSCIFTLINSKSAIWLYPTLALLSTIWSQTPGFTLRTSVELFCTVAFAIISAKHLSPRHLLSAVLCGLSVIAVISLSVRGFVIDPLTGSVDFVGPFGSKNQLAFFIAILWVTSLAVALDRGQPAIFRLFGIPCFVACGPLLVLARSATSDLTAIGSIVIFLGNFAISRLTVSQRARGIFAMIVIMVPALILLAMLWGTLQADILSLLGKDATLTGRTVLWERAFQLIPEHPWLGQGYDAFWRDNYVELEALWALFQLRHGFSFHNALIEAMVGTGYIGAAVLVYFIIDTFIRSLSWSWHTGSIPASYFVTLMFVLIVRCYVEVDLLYPFSLGTFFCIMSAHYSREICLIGVTAYLGTLRALASSDGYLRLGP